MSDVCECCALACTVLRDGSITRAEESCHCVRDLGTSRMWRPWPPLGYWRQRDRYRKIPEDRKGKVVPTHAWEVWRSGGITPLIRNLGASWCKQPFLLLGHLRAGEAGGRIDHRADIELWKTRKSLNPEFFLLPSGSSRCVTTQKTEQFSSTATEACDQA